MAVEAAEASGESPKPEEHRDGQLQEAVARAQQYPLARQSSLLSLTLDEIQRSVFEPWKTLGSMNVDDFLANIWTNEEGTAMASAVGVGGSDSNNHSSGGPNVTANNDLPPPTSLCREGSLSIPATLCHKTADEVWSEIQRNQRQPGRLEQQRYQSSGNSARQPPFGEMTLEDFLIKAGVVQEGGYIPCAAPQHLNQFHLLGHHHQQKENNYGLHGSVAMMNERSGYTPTVSVGYGVRQVNPGATTANGAYHYYQEQQQQGGVRNGYGGGGGGDGYAGGGGIGDSHIGVGSPVSTASSDGFGCGGQVDYRNPSGQRGADTGGGLTGGRGRAGAAGSSGGGAAAGRKRVLEGPVEKVKERRRRRMIKNRESAARSRARKQAYTVELYTQLNQLKDENASLQEEQRRLVARRQQMLLESMAERSQRNLQMNAKTLRQCCSCVW